MTICAIKLPVELECDAGVVASSSVETYTDAPLQIGLICPKSAKFAGLALFLLSIRCLP
jgi:hypothetical protein